MPSSRKTGDEEVEEDETDDDLLQFDFEASINAKKKTLNGLVPNVSSNALLARDTASSQPASNMDEVNADECDKEKMDAIKNKQQKEVVFDMFADDDDYETVSHAHI